MTKKDDNAGAADAGAASRGDGTNLSGGAPSNSDKPVTASAGNAPNDEFHSAKPTASGAKRKLGDQVQPETQLNEADGNRTLAKPRTDPGPVAHPWNEGGGRLEMFDRSKGQQTFRDANPEPVGTAVIRTSTTPPHFAGEGGVTSEVDVHAEQLGIGGASDCYNPEGRENASLTQRAVERSNEAKEVAPVVP